MIVGCVGAATAMPDPVNEPEAAEQVTDGTATTTSNGPASASAKVQVEVIVSDADTTGISIDAETGAIPEITASTATAPVAAASLSLDVDLEVPRTLWHLIERGAATSDELATWVGLPGNREILDRGIPPAHLADNAGEVVRGTATEDRQPLGRPGTVRMEPLDTWRRTLDWLTVSADSLARRAAGHAVAFVPPEIEMPPVTAYFHLGGGWDARTTDAIYVNLTVLLDRPQPSLDGLDALLARELMQVATMSALGEFIDFESTDAALLTGMQQMLNQGMMRFVERRLLRSVYPEGSYAGGVVRDHAAADVELFESMRRLDLYAGNAAMGRAAVTESLLVESLRDGTFPALGDLVCRTVFAHGGAQAVGSALVNGPTGAFSFYQQTAAERPDLPELPIALASRLDGLREGLESRWVRAEQGRREAFAALDAGDYAAAREPLEQVMELLPGNPIDVYNLACVLAMTGHPGPAMVRLEEAVELGFRDPVHIAGDPDLESLRERSDYAALLERLGGGPAAGMNGDAGEADGSGGGGGSPGSGDEAEIPHVPTDDSGDRSTVDDDMNRRRKP